MLAHDDGYTDLDYNEYPTHSTFKSVTNEDREFDRETSLPFAILNIARTGVIF